MYSILRRFLFWFDGERVHNFTMSSLAFFGKIPFLKNLVKSAFEGKCDRIPVTVFGLTFKNPVGLAAGFDKNAEYLEALQLLGFGFVEIGTVTPLPQSGNEKPRLFRLTKDKALINRMGFNNDGANAVAEKLQEFKRKNTGIIIGGNIGKNKITPNDEAWLDYEKCFRALYDGVDYFVVNVSSPNTPGLRDLQQKDSLKKILLHLQKINREMPLQKPILLKISPDLNEHDLEDIIALSLEIELDGLVVSNTTISRDNLHSEKKNIERIGNGGLSGKPLFERNTQMLKIISEKTGGAIPLIASGGVFTGDDAKQKIQSGASLLQVYTGFIYEGPSIVKNICKAIKGFYPGTTGAI